MDLRVKMGAEAIRALATQ
ncbi:TPA: hypothetical protein ACHKFM_003864, partial [Escherichia coli]